MWHDKMGEFIFWPYHPALAIDKGAEVVHLGGEDKKQDT